MKPTIVIIFTVTVPLVFKMPIRTKDSFWFMGFPLAVTVDKKAPAFPCSPPYLWGCCGVRGWTLSSWGGRSGGRLRTSSTKDTMRSQLSVTPEIGPHRTLPGSECIFPKQCALLCCLLN